MNKERYSRQLILPGFGEEAQKKLEQANILVIGAGGLGCPALQYLTGAGVGRVGIVDGDRVSLSNLHRQPLYTIADIGQLKAEVAKKRTKAVNPEIVLETFPYFLDSGNCLDIIGRFDLILDCSDNFSTRYLVNDACALLNKPLIFAAVSGWEGQVAVFHYSPGSAVRTNYRDLFPVQPDAGEIPNCEENGVIGVLPGIIGTMQAAEAVKLITGIGEPLIGRLLCYDLLSHEHYVMEIIPSVTPTYHMPETVAAFEERWPKRAAMRRNIISIDSAQLNALLISGDALVIDIRETHEMPMLAISHIKLPLSQFSKDLLPEVPEHNIVLVCQQGMRSVRAAALLDEYYQGRKTLFSLDGGVQKMIGQ